MMKLDRVLEIIDQHIDEYERADVANHHTVEALQGLRAHLADEAECERIAYERASTFILGGESC